MSVKLGEVTESAPAALESATVTVKLTVPEDVGVPLRTPDFESEKPLLRPDALQVELPDPPDAAKVKE